MQESIPRIVFLLVGLSVTTDSDWQTHVLALKRRPAHFHWVSSSLSRDSDAVFGIAKHLPSPSNVPNRFTGIHSKMYGHYNRNSGRHFDKHYANLSEFLHIITISFPNESIVSW